MVALHRTVPAVLLFCFVRFASLLSSAPRPPLCAVPVLRSMRLFSSLSRASRSRSLRVARDSLFFYALRTPCGLAVLPTSNHPIIFSQTRSQRARERPLALPPGISFVLSACLCSKRLLTAPPGILFVDLCDCAESVHSLQPCSSFCHLIRPSPCSQLCRHGWPGGGVPSVPARHGKDSPASATHRTVCSARQSLPRRGALHLVRFIMPRALKRSLGCILCWRPRILASYCYLRPLVFLHIATCLVDWLVCLAAYGCWV